MPLVGAGIWIARGVGGVEGASNARIVQGLSKWEVAIALGGVGKGLVRKVVSAVESHVNAGAGTAESITDQRAVVYTPESTGSRFRPCVSSCARKHSHVRIKISSKPFCVRFVGSSPIFRPFVYRGHWSDFLAPEQSPPERRHP